MTESLAEALPREQKRCRELLEVYKELGPAGRFGAMMVEASLDEAEQAAMSGDVVRMLRAYKRLSEHK